MSNPVSVKEYAKANNVSMSFVLVCIDEGRITPVGHDGIRYLLDSDFPCPEYKAKPRKPIKHPYGRCTEIGCRAMTRKECVTCPVQAEELKQKR